MANQVATMSAAREFASSIPAVLAGTDLSVNALRPWVPATQREYEALRANGALQANALLRKDEWEELDARVVDVARARLTGIADLRSRGLVLSLGGLGTLISEYEKLGDMSGANVDMSGATEGEKDTVTFDLVGVPVPIIHKDYAINIRRLLASRKLGNALDTVQAAVAARLVADKLEDMLFNGVSVTVDGSTIYGYTTHPDRNTGSAAGDFGTITNIFPTINAMVAAAEADGYYGPYVLYAATAQYAEMRAVYTDGSGQTAMGRAIDAIPTLEAVRPGDALAAGSLVLATMSPDVVDLAVAQEISNVQWESRGGMVQEYKVMGAMVPRIKSSSGSKSGIVHYTGA